MRPLFPSFFLFQPRLLPSLIIAAVLQANPLGAETYAPPATQSSVDYTRREVQWVEPKPLALPSSEDLKTITVRDRKYEIHRNAPKAERGAARWEDQNESLTFVSATEGGRVSNERLIVENCTFVLDYREGDFESWDARRCAIYVEGYKEVVVRNCIFASKALPNDPMRKVVGSLVAYDCLNVQVEECYFEGRTIGWRGHVTVFCCGPTSIRNCEVNALGKTAGGIWVATGVGEGKIGWSHDDKEHLMIYPPGPLLVENCWVHDQKGKENSDGIYVQSVRPYLLRNCKVENWGPDDSLIDVGFRDTAKNKYNGKTLINHGGIGLVEHCEFANGYVKDSVGMAGGLIFRNNIMNNAWFFPYAFDGGSWYVLSNRFTNMSGVIVSGRNGGLEGWTPKEGMFANGSRMYVYNNLFEYIKKPKALYVNGAPVVPLKEIIVSDYNIYNLPTAPDAWAVDKEVTFASLEDWQKASGNDKNSIVGAATTEKFQGVAASVVKLPGSVPMAFGKFEAGLLEPAGVQNEELLKKARELSKTLANEYNSKFFSFQAETANPKGDLKISTVKRTWAEGGAYLHLEANNGSKLSLEFETSTAGRYFLNSILCEVFKPTTIQATLNGTPLGGEASVDAKRKQQVRHGAADLPAGKHELVLRFSEPSTVLLDAVRLEDAKEVEQEIERSKKSRDIKDREAAAKAKADVARIKLPFSAIRVVNSAKHSNHPAKAGADYMLWQANGLGDTLRFEFELPQSDLFKVGIVMANQADKGEVTLEIDGKSVGEPTKLAKELKFAFVELASGKHNGTLKLSAGNTEGSTKIRLMTLWFQPKGADPVSPLP